MNQTLRQFAHYLLSLLGKQQNLYETTEYIRDEYIRRLEEHSEARANMWVFFEIADFATRTKLYNLFRAFAVIWKLLF